MVTIRDVAKASGYSPSTISIVLNNAPLARYIPESTKTRIKETAESLGYHPNQFARSLRSKQSLTVGVIVFDITDPYCTQILKGIESALYQTSYLPILADTQNNRARFKKLTEVMLERKVEGLIAIANSVSLKMDILESLERQSVPMVVIGRELGPDSISSVVVDNELGARSAFEHLHDLGHRRIAVLRGPRTLVDSAERWEGIRRAARERGAEIDPKLTLEMKNRTPSHEGGFQLTEELLGRGREFTALLAFDDMTAFGAIRALAASGRRVPDDCSVVGFDDVAAAAFYNPPLTTVRQPMDTLGSISVQTLLAAVKAARGAKPAPAVREKVAPELVVRETTGPWQGTGIRD